MKSKRTKKPQTVAAVTPSGVQALVPAAPQRPLIAHIPIRSSDIDFGMFAFPATEEEPSGPLKAFGDGESTMADYPAQAPAQAQATQQAPVASHRPSLPLHFSEQLNVRFNDANREQRLPASTDVVCFWDCHPFRGTPAIIPMSIDEGIWRVYGNFCSPECAAAHLFNERLDSHVQWERYALLNRLYSDGGPTHLAPPKTVLRLFGGNLDIGDYRDILAEKRMRIDVATPPMISILQVMDTKPIDFYDAMMKNTLIPWEMNRMNRPGAQGLRLRRTKPVFVKETTLEYCMGISLS